MTQISRRTAITRLPPAAKRQSARKCKADRDLPYGLTRDNLPFVQRLNGGEGCTGNNLCHWVVKSTGSYATDCDLGQEYARLFIPFLRVNLGPMMLAWIVLDMTEFHTEETKGIVVGFMKGIGDAASEWRACSFVLARRRAALAA
jgi:hypothetical protein